MQKNSANKRKKKYILQTRTAAIKLTLSFKLIITNSPCQYHLEEYETNNKRYYSINGVKTRENEIKIKEK